MAEVRYGVATEAERGERTGLQVLRAIIAGELPQAPIARALGFLLVDAGPGHATFEGHTSAALLNPMGGVHGGWALTLIDSATGCAGYSQLGSGTGYTTLETKANFSRPILADSGTVRCEGRVVSAGRRIISAEAVVRDAEGRILAHGTSTLLVLQ